MTFRINLPDTLDIRISPINAEGNFKVAVLPLADMTEANVILALTEGVGTKARDLMGDKKYNTKSGLVARYATRKEYVETKVANGDYSGGGRQTDVVLEALRQACLEYGAKKSECKNWNYQRIQNFFDNSVATTFDDELAEVKRGLERKAKIVASLNPDTVPEPPAPRQIESGPERDDLGNIINVHDE